MHHLLCCRTHDNESIIQLMMDRLPQERLKRNVVRGRLDVIGKLYFLNFFTFTFTEIQM